MSPNHMALQVSPSRVSNQDLCAMGLDAAPKPGVQAVDQHLLIEHVSKQDEVPAFGLSANQVLCLSGEGF